MALPPEDRDLIERVLGVSAFNAPHTMYSFEDVEALLAAARAEAAPVVDEAYIERIVEAFERATEFSWSCNLTRLVDGDRTYTLTTPEGSEDFGGVSEAHERLDEIKSMRRRAALEAALTQPNGGQDA